MHSRTSTSRSRRRFRPRVPEALEARTLPSFLAPVNYDTGGQPLSVAVGDFNGDALPDLATANNAHQTVSVLLGNGDGAFQDAAHYPAGINPGSVAGGDFDGDGRLDLAVTNTVQAGTVSVLLGNGDGSFQPPAGYGAGPTPASVSAGDFNGDQVLDLVVTNPLSS